MRGLASKQSLREVGRLSAVDNAEVERLEQAWTAEAIKEAEDVCAEDDEAESAYPG